KRFAEMTETRIPHLRRSFGHIVTARAQQLGRTLHPQIAQILGNGETNLARKNTAEIKRAATDFLPEHFKRWRIRQIMAQQFLSSLDPFARYSLLPHA